MNMAGGLGTVLFGGSFGVSMGMNPIGEATVADYKRLNAACDLTPKGGFCKIEGPAEFHMKTKKGNISLDVARREQAEVHIVKSYILCRDGLG